MWEEGVVQKMAFGQKSEEIKERALEVSVGSTAGKKEIVQKPRGRSEIGIFTDHQGNQWGWSQGREVRGIGGKQERWGQIMQGYVHWWWDFRFILNR